MSVSARIGVARFKSGVCITNDYAMGGINHEYEEEQVKPSQAKNHKEKLAKSNSKL